MKKFLALTLAVGMSLSLVACSGGGTTEPSTAPSDSGAAVSDCKRVQEVYRVRCPYPLSAGDIVRRRK